MKKQPVDREEFSREKQSRQFAEKLLWWNRYDNTRQMPWKGEKNPYRIWLSEVILQQTRVEQGLKYYQNFIAAFPDVHALANAPDEKVFKLWEGLGYYSRCRNLLHAARYISKELGGRFPTHYDAILALKGVGAYTAAAIASFAYNEPYAVLDGNVFRVLSRIFDEEVAIDTTYGKKRFTQLAQATLPHEVAGEYNQAIMDFGATICKPQPICDRCFLNQDCLAYRLGRQQLLPVKEKKSALRQRWLNYFVVQSGKEVLVQQRLGKDIWQDLYQFFLIETEKGTGTKKLQQRFQEETGILNYHLADHFKEKQVLSHQKICFHFFVLQLEKKLAVRGYEWRKRSELAHLAFPRTLQRIVQTFLS